MALKSCHHSAYLECSYETVAAFWKGGSIVCVYSYQPLTWIRTMQIYFTFTIGQKEMQEKFSQGMTLDRIMNGKAY